MGATDRPRMLKAEAARRIHDPRPLWRRSRANAAIRFEWDRTE